MTLLAVQLWEMPDHDEPSIPWPPIKRRKPAQLPPTDRRDSNRCACGHSKGRHRAGSCEACAVKHSRDPNHPTCDHFVSFVGMCKACHTDRLSTELERGVCNKLIATRGCLSRQAELGACDARYSRLRGGR